MIVELNEEEHYILRMIVKVELDELPDLINAADSNDKKELLKYRHNVESLYNKIK